MNLVEQHSATSGPSFGTSFVPVNAAGQDLSQRPGLNRQMADFNISSKPVQNKQKLGPGASQVIPMAQCEMQHLDDNRSEYSVRTHSQFGQTSSYFSGAVPSRGHHGHQHSPMSQIVHNRDQQIGLDHYNLKVQ